MMRMLGIDLGTTNRKVGLFEENGEVVGIVSRPTLTQDTGEGYVVYDAEQLWTDVVEMIRELTEQHGGANIAAIGIASMAESGLLLHKDSGAIQSPLLPWFDTSSTPQAERVREADERLKLFQRSGLHLSFKHGLPKLLWLHDRDPDMFRDARWVSVSGFIAYRLSGVMAFDPSLATRTFVYDMRTNDWDREWIQNFGLSPDLFPDVYPSGAPLGSVKPELMQALGLSSAPAVAVSGHDHVCASLAVGAVAPGDVFASMGTAETLVGLMEPTKLGEEDFQTGLSYGYHVIPGLRFWMGGNPSSGGSLEWIRRQLGDEALSYDEVRALLTQAERYPCDVMFFPYLSGSGAPHPNSNTRGAFIGLSNNHGKAELLQAVCEGTSYQLEMIRRSGERVCNQSITEMRAVGGGTRAEPWLQMKADVTGATMIVPTVDEATLLGAAYTAMLGTGHIADGAAIQRLIEQRGTKRVEARAELHERYQRAYAQRYEPTAAFLRQLPNIE
ncbi:FGGY family carbohydrate kinase [Paenibacillus sp. SC116]|uniref:FGGY-family carbohydrate kinase n=1 Tax=Paenibacillus sp. SC116 TaxID=2968986 RepID=UPI00215A14A5|nr:FGGY family carbohydrate kinase [Paenibacillus sp. SC116]MCR8845942.1 FGGY family carbohydrate kinase [Paenibacillus sp. SC116]